MLKQPLLFDSTKVNESNSLGLIITQSIALQFPKSSGLQVTSQINYGTKFKFCIEIKEPIGSSETIGSTFTQNIEEFLEEDTRFSCTEYIFKNPQNIPSLDPTTLIVDDDSFNLLVLENILKSFGLKSVKAFNG